MIIQFATDIGLIRNVNEDNLAIIEPDTFVVADGMGGQSAGEIASQMLTDTVKEELKKYSTIGTAELRRALAISNTAIYAAASENVNYSGMGTTATLLHIENGKAFWVHVGDSRLYLYRDGKLKQLTKDHSYVTELLELGEITEEEASTHPQKNLLLRAIGVEQYVQIDSGEMPLEVNDVFLLATDGLMKMVSDEKIAAFLAKLPDNNVVQELIDASLASGGIDNVTAIVVVNNNAKNS